jgi:hypothetical protein
MMEIGLADIWIAAGVIFGFQITWFSWRISREIEMGKRNEITWLPVADWINLTSMLITVIGVFILPILGIKELYIIKRIFGYALLLIVGHAFALAGHYQLFRQGVKKRQPYLPRQERIVILIIGILSISYLALSLLIKKTV